MNAIFFTKPTARAQAIEAKLLEGLNQASLNLPPLVIAIGGDGTMLQAIKEHWREEAIFVGISAGRLGFLQSVEADQIPQFIDALAHRTYSTITAPLLVARLDGQPLGYAFNDISIERSGPRAARCTVNIGASDGTFIGDGLIFATPLGSTAYSLAAGGPIIDSKAQDMFVVTPNNPHVSTLYSSLQRPHVLDRSRQAAIAIESADVVERPAQLIIDGQVAKSPLDHPVTIGLSDRTVRLMQLEHDGFHNRIEQKRLGRY